MLIGSVRLGQGVATVSRSESRVASCDLVADSQRKNGCESRDKALPARKQEEKLLFACTYG